LEAFLPYVMVPVPEEHVAAVMQFILQAIQKASLEEWDAESLANLWEDADEATRSLLAFAARAASSQTELEVGEAARQIQLTQRDVTAIVNELSSVAREASRAPLLSLRTTTERLPNGRTTQSRVVSISPEVAETIREVERAELLGATPSEARQ
jgi:hypothetical protein